MHWALLITKSSRRSILSDGLLEHIGEENPFYERLIDLADSFGHGNPRQRFQRWSYVEPELRDLVGKMTNLDPTKRILRERLSSTDGSARPNWKFTL